jgi:Arylsulfotransferase (ASST)
VVIAAAAQGALAAPGTAFAAQVAVYPTPGDHYELPRTQIAFRGVPVSQIGPISVVGSASGPHPGTVQADSDGGGGSFIPAQPFAAGETVTVTTTLNIVGATGGKFSFTIEHPGPPPGAEVLPLASGPHGIQRFRSRPDLEPAAVTVTKDSAPATDGDIFVAPQFGPTQDGPMILDAHGNLVWFHATPVSNRQLVTDFRVQQLGGAPVLTWWQGTTSNGSGSGHGVIYNRDYQQIATVNAADGLHMDLHEFLITNDGDAYIIAISPIRLPHYARTVENAVIQEIDIKTGLVLFQWDALDHVALSDSYVFSTKEGGRVLDPFHANSVTFDASGNLVVSMRNTDAVYNINRATGAILWTLGGKSSTFKLGKGVRTAFQHDAEVQPGGQLTIFDDGAGPPQVHPYSRAIRVAINTNRHAATLVSEYRHAPNLSAAFEGSAQTLPGGDVFIGWGQQPYFSEDNSGGKQDFDAHFTVPTSSYRAYRFPWTAQPPTQPAFTVGLSPSGVPQLYESWNGATDVAAWRVLEGTRTTSLAPIGRQPKYHFESTLSAPTGDAEVEVQALAADGHVLATTAPRAVPSHVTILGGSAFAPSSGFIGIPVGCHATHRCSIVTSLTSGHTLLGRSGTERVGAGTGGELFVRLSPAARRRLARSRTHRLAVQATAHDASGLNATTTLQLVAFSSSGAGPKRTFSAGSIARIVGGSEFVSSTGIGDVLTDCRSRLSCHVTTTVSVGATVIARSKPEYLDPGQLGYLRFQLTRTGRSMLAHASGHQLGAHISITGTGSTARAEVALIPFS